MSVVCPHCHKKNNSTHTLNCQFCFRTISSSNSSYSPNSGEYSSMNEAVSNLMDSAVDFISGSSD